MAGLLKKLPPNFKQGGMKMSRRIIGTQILVEWSDSPKLEVLLHDMPSDLQQDFDEWLITIEEEENAK